MFGNNVAHSERKTRRTWLPNLQRHKYFSPILNKQLRLKLTTEAMRNIDKCGGFDNYILRTNEVLLGGPRSMGVRMKHQMQQAYENKKQMDAYQERSRIFAEKLAESIKRTELQLLKKSQEQALRNATETAGIAANAAI